MSGQIEICGHGDCLYAIHSPYPERPWCVEYLHRDLVFRESTVGDNREYTGFWSDRKALSDAVAEVRRRIAADQSATADRTSVCVNALAGMDKPENIPALIQAAKRADAKAKDIGLAYDEFDELRSALAALYEKGEAGK